MALSSYLTDRQEKGVQKSCSRSSGKKVSKLTFQNWYFFETDALIWLLLSSGSWVPTVLNLLLTYTSNHSTPTAVQETKKPEHPAVTWNISVPCETKPNDACVSCGVFSVVQSFSWLLWQAVVAYSMFCTLTLRWWMWRCLCVCVRTLSQGGRASFWEGELQPRQTWEKTRVISSASTNGLHRSLYLDASVLLMNEVFCDSQSQYARGMLPYHQVMNECEE